MALTNVWRRGSDGEWERTTAAQEDAERDYSVSVKAASYRCYSCFQYVTFVKGGVSRASHFKHSRGDVNKDCEDRSQYASRSIDYIPSDMPMPMRLSIQGSHALFQIGLLPIGDEELNRAIAAKLTITLKGNRGVSRVYRVDRSRFSPHITTWIDLPEEWICRYQLSFEPSQSVPGMWKRKALSIGDDGALFDASTSRRLPERSDVQVGREYYFVKDHSAAFSYSEKDICLERVNVQGYNAWVYKVKALRYSSRSSDFFFDYMKMRLTQKPAEIEIVWPPVLEEDNVLTTNLRTLWVLSKGEADLQTYPRSGQYVRSTLPVPIEKAKLLEIQNVSTLQMVCAERYSLSIACLYVRPLEDYTVPGIPGLQIMDDDSSVVLSNIMEQPPQKGTLHIISDVDGSADIFDDRGFYYRKVLKAGEDTRITDIKKGETIVIRQGLDIIRKIEIGRHIAKGTKTENVQPWISNEMPFPKRYAAVLERLDSQSDVYQRVSNALKKGSIPKDGLKYLQKMMEVGSDE